MTWQGPFIGALAGFCLAVIVAIFQWQQTASDIHKASQNNDMAGMAYLVILPGSAIVVIFATAVGAVLGWVGAAVWRRWAGRHVAGDGSGLAAAESASAAGGCLGVAAVYLAGMVVGAVAGGLVGLAWGWASLAITHPNSETAGFLPILDALIGGCIGLIVGLAVASHKSKEL